MSGEVETTRAYRSPVRAQQAAETRHRVVTAAGELFAEQGYTKATMREIAARAGVSLETVRSHGPKPALLRAAIDLAGFGVEGTDDIAGLDAGQVLLALQREELPAAVAAFLADLHEIVGDLFSALVGAAANDPEVAELYATVVGSIRRQWHEVVVVVRDRGWISDADTDFAADQWLLVAGPDTYLQIRRFGWSKERYRDWLEEDLTRRLGLN